MISKHDALYINWRLESNSQKLSIKEGREKVAFFEKNGVKAASKTKRSDWRENNSYCLSKRGYWITLYTREGFNYHRYIWHSGDDSKNEQTYKPQGQVAIQTIHKYFRERTGKTFLGAFGYSDGWDFRKCVPRQFYYYNPIWENKNLSNINLVDYSSHYPANCCGALPTLKDSQWIEGQVEPNKQYPFAFYIRSGHCAEFDRFDTRKWKDYKIGGALLEDDFARPYYRDIDPSQDMTVLCKKADFELTEEFNYFYNLRKTDETAKIVMNATIGFFHPKSARESFRMFHIAAVCIARANQKVLELSEQIRPSSILQIITDSIIYYGNPRCGQKEKELGALVKEIEYADFRMRGTNQYIFMKNNKVIKVAHSGFNENIICHQLEDINNWRKI